MANNSIMETSQTNVSAINSTNLTTQGTTVAVAPIVAAAGAAAINAIRAAAVIAAKRYGPAGAIGFVVGLSAGNQLRVGANNPVAIGAIAAAGKMLSNAGVFKPDQAAVFTAAAGLGLKAGGLIPKIDIASNKQLVDALASATGMSANDVKSMLNVGANKAAQSTANANTTVNSIANASQLENKKVANANTQNRSAGVRM
jgi:hypothetical protein